MKKIDILCLLLLILQQSISFAQKSISDKTFENWLLKNNNIVGKYNYFVILNPNAACNSCFINQVEAISRNSFLTKKICIITHEGAYNNILPLKNNKNLKVVVLENSFFNSLTYLRYRNALLDFSQDGLKLLLKLNTINADSLAILLNK